MIKFTKDKLNSLKQSFVNKKIAIIGDMMLDSYIWGKVNRISPEAPVPVIEVENEFTRFGGAANCALNISTLKSIPLPVGVIGYDSYGSDFLSLLNDSEINPNGIFTVEDRPTTAKTRVIAANQHVVRIDKEKKIEIDEATENKIISFFNDKIKEIDALILQDYNKGVLTNRIICEIIDIANKNNKIITVDPKFNNFYSYKNVTVFKPNRKEAEDALGIKISNAADIEKAGKLIQEKLNAKYVLLTLGEEGIALFENGKELKKLPTKARKVADVSGAGDTVISTLTIALAAGADIVEAAYLANWAGGLVCEVAGIIPIEIDNLFNTIEKSFYE